MRRRGSRNWLGGLVVLLIIVAAAAVLLVQLRNYSTAWNELPPGLTIGGLPAGGRSPGVIGEQLRATYNQPVILVYQDHLVELQPVEVGLQIDVDGALAEAEKVRGEIDFWGGFVDYLLDRSNAAASVELSLTYAPELLTGVLEGIAIRFDEPARSPQPDTSSLTFSAGSRGHALDVEGSLPLIDAALRSAGERTVTLVVRERAIPPPEAKALELMLTTRLARFDGVAGVTLVDLRTGEEMCLNCEVAFSGMSMLEVPVAVATYRQLGGAPDEQPRRLISSTLTLGGHSSANTLLAWLGGGDASAGVETLNDEVHRLGLQNTFLAAPFEVLPEVRVNTPANSRLDVTTNPDPAMQTTPLDAALLLRMVYDCGMGGGALLAAWPGDFGPEECHQLLDAMEHTAPGELLAAPLPPGTHVAQHFGWNGPTLAGSGVVTSPGGDYVLTVFLWRDGWLEWRSGAEIIEDVSRASFNFFNGDAQVR